MNKILCPWTLRIALLLIFCQDGSAQQGEIWRSILGPRTEEIKAAAEAGDAGSQFRLGQAYQSRQSPTNALFWYRKAAQQGNADGQNALANMLFRGHGIKSDSREAVRWLTLAANQGQVNAQLRMADIYEDGRDVKRDYAESLKWLTLAEKKASIVSRVKADALVLKMKPEEIADGKKRANSFVLTPPEKVLPTLKLQGVMGTGKNAAAIINGKTLKAGEETTIKSDEQPLKVKCLQISTNAVTVAVQGEAGPRVLRIK